MATKQPSSPQTVDAPPRHLILGTAGHIDHGKTSLVRALTGTDTDRLPEERRRGMTIELGFADLVIEDTTLGVVDVPGHERFVRTMVAGATGIDVALIVVAADDSVMPQTIEHVEILNLLGVSRGVVAVTKIDTVDSELVELVVDDVQLLLADSPLADVPICPVSSVSGAGLDELRRAIHQVCSEVETAPAGGPFRLAVDRVFTVQGRGTVVTGSVGRGMVVEGDSLEVLPAGVTCRVRGLQTHGAHVDRLESGRRAAINVSGIDRALIERGTQLATPGFLHPMHMIDVRLDYLASCPRPLKSTSVVRLEVATTEQPVRVVLLEGNTLAPGSSSYAQLRSGQPLFVTHGERFIIRDESATRTIGGGTVIAPRSTRRKRDRSLELDRLQRLESGDAAGRLEQVLRLTRFARPTDLQLCAWAGVEMDELEPAIDDLREQKRWLPVGATGVHAIPDAIDDLADRLTRWLKRHHEQHPELPGRAVDSVLGYLERLTDRNLGKALFELLTRRKTFKLLGRFVCLPAFAPSLSAADEKLLAAMIAEILAGVFSPPRLDELTVAAQGDRKRWDRLATLAVALGELVIIEPKMYLHVDIERQLRDRVGELIRNRGGVTVADVRESLGSTRKFVVPFLEYLDRIRFTKRTGDTRQLAEPGPG